MPSKNSINRPKDTMLQAKKNASASRKRQQREAKGLVAPARSSAESMSGKIKSVPLEIYKGNLKTTGPTTTHTLSKKRSKKIERNLKYIKQRKMMEQNLLIDASAQLEMQVDEQEEAVAKPQSKLEKVKEAIWSVIEDASAQGFVAETSGEGTTLGEAAFY